MTKKAQSLVVERMHRKEQKEDVDQPALLVKITREEAENLRKERLERLVEKKIKDFTAGLKGEDNMTWKEILKGKGERHFFEDGEQWTGETHKHPDGTLMSGKEHVEGESKKLYHLHELSEKVLRHLSKETTEIE
tara:strand:- start:287 stop:691 length:405 start_codon:yes stop_codon:yes gene_type:complete